MFNRFKLIIKKKSEELLKGEGLKAKFGRGTLWAFVGFSGKVFLRMISSLILTRIFLPDVFGLMAIITAIVAGIELLSDVGINPSIIQNRRGDSSVFLRTAWTLQVVRGFFLWIMICLVSFPLSTFYNEPDLILLLPVIGTTFVIRGFISTSLALHIRFMKVERVIILELVTQLVTLALTVILALLWQNIWAIVIGQIISSVVFTVCTYYYLKDGVVGFQWDRVVVNDVVRFGKWIFLSTMLTFIVGQGDRLIFGAVMTKTELGLYNLAALFSQLSMGLFGALVGRNVMPALANIHNNVPTELNTKFNSIRKLLMFILLPFVILTSVFGNVIIKNLYIPEYHGAGGVLQVLSAGMVIQIICLSISPIFLATGDSFRHMLSYLFWATIFISSMLIGYMLNGIVGLIFGIAIAPLFWLPFISVLASKYVTVNNRLSLYFLFSSSLLIAFGWWLAEFNPLTMLV